MPLALHRRTWRYWFVTARVSPSRIAKRGRKAKHLAHYHGPAIVQGNVEGRDRQYHITYDGKQFKRDISMLIPERTIKCQNMGATG